MTVDRRIAWAIEVMQAHMHQPLSVADLAQRVNLSRSRFTHLFREQTGVSPARYLRDFRLDRARLLLETTFLSVKQVMAAVGVNDASHFSRDFRRAFGASPREWRKRVQRPPPQLEVAPSAKKPRTGHTLHDASAAAERLSSKA